jgi:hypothetical protein
MMPGARDGHVYPLAKPDLARAQSLMDDRRPTLVLAVCDEPNCIHAGRLIVRDLGGLRIESQGRFGTRATSPRGRGELAPTSSLRAYSFASRTHSRS